MTWPLMWLNVSIATLNVTLQLLELYRLCINAQFYTHRVKMCEWVTFSILQDFTHANVVALTIDSQF